MMKQKSIYDLPNYYDWTSEGLDYDTTYYTDLAKTYGGPVLELGCGTGRISLAMAREGIEVVGLDLSANMLGQAKVKAEAMSLNDKIHWVQADMAKFELNQKFPLIIIPYRSFLHITCVKEQFTVLKKVAQHLTEDGMFAFNVFVPHPTTLTTMEGTHHFRGSFPIPGTDEDVEVYDTTEYDHYYQLVYVNRYYERFAGTGESLERIRAFIKFRYIYPTELSHLLTLGGFCIRARYGTFTREPFHSQSQELIVEASLS